MSKKTKPKTKKSAFLIRKAPQTVFAKIKIKARTKKSSFPKNETLLFVVCIPFFGLAVADLLELELWPRWIYWDDVSSFVDTLSLSRSGLVVVLFLFYNLIKKNKASILSKIFLHFKEKSSEPLFGNERPDSSIISPMIYFFCYVLLLIIVSFFFIWVLIPWMISLVVSILLFTPFFDRTIESRDFMVIEHRVKSRKGNDCYKTVFKEVNGTLKADICNEDFYHQVNTGSHLKITGTNTLFGFVYKIKEVEVLKF